MIVGTQTATSGQRFLSSTSWEGYLQILEAFKDRRLKITYDRGALELLSPSTTHEQIKTILAQIVEFACLVKEVDYFGGGSTTFRRKILEKGLEPDECYYFETEVVKSADINQEEYPAPDLVIEVEVSQSALNRVGILQALGVKEVWRYTSRHQVVILVLGPEGYEERKVSQFLPFLKPADVPPLVRKGLELCNNRLLFHSIREHLES